MLTNRLFYSPSYRLQIAKPLMLNLHSGRLYSYTSYTSYLETKISYTNIPQPLTAQQIEQARKKRIQANHISSTLTQTNTLSNTKSQTTNHSKGQRLAKVLARFGYGSRRTCEQLINAGHVRVNGSQISSCVMNVVGNEKIEVYGKNIENRSQNMQENIPLHPKLFIVHKLKGELVTRYDPKGRPTIFSRLEYMGLPKNLISIGRLDFNTEGLLLLTNDGDFARYMEHPAAGIKRVYRVLVFGNPRNVDRMVRSMSRGVVVNNVRYKPAAVSTLTTQGHKSWVRIVVTEGKNKEIRKLMTHFHLAVKRLLRDEYGPYALGNLSPGDVLDEVLPTNLLQQSRVFKHNFPKLCSPMISEPIGRTKVHLLSANYLS